ncbi:nonsense-mediated decay protein 4 [Maudiozyma exigua]|uniref:Nonsense-mediated decay protein 4 n=1 Tax=Maudiozyma exigua TaxID=34358 RepID=A0A9P7B853_MAUEX|nr:nonsense-mediated decay protein 4 [Kazachstania exigua]
MNQYNFVVDASAFEKGLGNIKRWCNRPSNKITINLYIPTFTLKELDFLQHRRKSFSAKESLKYIDTLTNIPSYNENDHDSSQNPPVEVIVEFPELLDSINWDDVNINGISSLDRLPRRLKNLLKSAAYKCLDMDNNDPLRWILLTEDPQIRDAAKQCDIPSCSIVDVDNILSKELNLKSFQNSEKFNNMVMKNGTRRMNENGNDLVMTDFNKTMYASRGNGKLWSP